MAGNKGRTFLLVATRTLSLFFDIFAKGRGSRHFVIEPVEKLPLRV
jgi:hypothetical protein